MFSSIETLRFVFIDIVVLFAFICPVILQKQEMKSCRRPFPEFGIDLTNFLIKHLITFLSFRVTFSFNSEQKSLYRHFSHFWQLYYLGRTGEPIAQICTIKKGVLKNTCVRA